MSGILLFLPLLVYLELAAMNIKSFFFLVVFDIPFQYRVHVIATILGYTILYPYHTTHIMLLYYATLCICIIRSI